MYPSREDTRVTLSWIVWVLLIFFIFVVIAASIAFALGWITWPLDWLSRGNVEEQFRTGYDLHNSLEATAQLVCDAEAAVEAAIGDDAKNQRQTQLIGYQSNYARLAGDYNKWAENVFAGKVVRPPDLPYRAPSLEAMKSQVCGY